MDGFLFALAGVFLQVLNLMATFGGLMVKVAELLLKVLLKEPPRSSEEDEPRHK